MSPQMSQLPSVDYTGAELSIGQSVTFIEADQERSGKPRLYTGQIKLLGVEQLVVESNGRLFMLGGREDRHKGALYFATVLGLPASAKEQ